MYKKGFLGIGKETSLRHFVIACLGGTQEGFVLLFFFKQMRRKLHDLNFLALHGIVSVRIYFHILVIVIKSL